VFISQTVEQFIDTISATERSVGACYAVYIIHTFLIIGFYMVILILAILTLNQQVTHLTDGGAIK
jgi:hypothetical protein